MRRPLLFSLLFALGVCFLALLALRIPVVQDALLRTSIERLVAAQRGGTLRR
jgi:hypothetical protein